MTQVSDALAAVFAWWPVLVAGFVLLCFIEFVVEAGRNAGRQWFESPRRAVRSGPEAGRHKERR